MGFRFAKMASAAAVLSLLSTRAFADPFELDFSVEANLEYASSQLRTAEYGNFFSPFVWVDDWRAGTVIEITGTRRLGSYQVTGVYTYDQVSHEDETNLDWTIHTGEISLVKDLASAGQIGIGYKAISGVPESWFGDTRYDVVTTHWLLPDYQVNESAVLFKPGISLEWEELDPKLAPFFKWERVNGEISLQMRPSQGRWISELYGSYGHIETATEFFRHDYASLEWVHGLTLARESYLELDLYIRKEWYEIANTDEATANYDKQIAGIVTYSTPLRREVSLDLTLELVDHYSTDTGLDYFETKTRFALITRF